MKTTVAIAHILQAEGIEFLSELLQFLACVGVDDRRPGKQDWSLCISEGFHCGLEIRRIG